MSATENTVETIGARLAGGETSARAVAEKSLDAAERLNPALNAFLQIDREGALRRAEELGASSDASGATLRGVPIAIKDNICVRGLQATCGSRILADYHPPYDATVIERLNAAGAVIVGKTNCDEFAMGSSNENSAFGPVRNPWDTERVPGGSSGGSAAAVAARIVPVALGSETGGSVRQTGVPLRHRRRQTHLRARLALRPRRLRLVARSGERLRSDCERRGARPCCHRRPRPERFDDC